LTYFPDKVLYHHATFFILAGNCTITPEVGTVIADTFMMSCSGWQDQHLPLTYEFYLKQDGVKAPLCNSFQLYCNEPLPMGDAANNFVLEIFVSISDRHGGKSITSMNATVSYSHNI